MSNCYKSLPRRCEPRLASPHPSAPPCEEWQQNGTVIEKCFDGTAMSICDILNEHLTNGTMTQDEVCAFYRLSHGARLVFDEEFPAVGLKFSSGSDPVPDDAPMPFGERTTCTMFVGAWEFCKTKFVVASGAGPVCVKIMGVTI